MRTILCCLVLLCGLVAAEEMVKVTTFDLANGKQVKAIKVSKRTSELGVTYTITSLEGLRQHIAEEEVKSISEAMVAWGDLPNTAKAQIKRDIAQKQDVEAARVAETEAVKARAAEWRARQDAFAAQEAAKQKEAQRQQQIQAEINRALAPWKEAELEVTSARLTMDAVGPELAKAQAAHRMCERIGDYRGAQKAAETIGRLQPGYDTAAATIQNLQAQLPTLRMQCEAAADEIRKKHGLK